MNIYDTPFKGSQERSFQDPHESCQNDQVHAGILEDLYELGLGNLAQFGAKWAWLHKFMPYAKLAGQLQDASAGNVAHHHRRFGRKASFGQGRRYGAKIGSTTRPQNAQTE